jgi:nitric oxide reductase large subunit
VWTGVSILVLLAGIGGLGFWHAARRKDDPPAALPDRDPMLGAVPTPSQLATVKYFWVVCGLFVLQLLVGIITAHYGVEGSSFYGIPIAFWAINLGLGAMVLLSVLPVGLLQTWAAVDRGYWYARSAEFLHTPLMDTLRWLRVIGDTVFAAGAIAFVVAVVRLTVAPARVQANPESAHPAA